MTYEQSLKEQEDKEWRSKRIKEGMVKARLKGRIPGRRKGGVKSLKQLLSDHKDIANLLLGRDKSIRKIASICGVSKNTVLKVKQHIEGINAENRRKQKLYLIRCGEFCKIGVATSPENRLKELQTGNPIKLSLDETIEIAIRAGYVERILHRVFREKRVEGEWFRLSSEDYPLVRDAVDYIQSLPKCRLIGKMSIVGVTNEIISRQLPLNTKTF